MVVEAVVPVVVSFVCCSLVRSVVDRDSVMYNNDGVFVMVVVADDDDDDENPIMFLNVVVCVCVVVVVSGWNAPTITVGATMIAIIERLRIFYIGSCTDGVFGSKNNVSIVWKRVLILKKR